MVSRVLMGVWAALDFLLLAAGAVALALSIVWRRPDLLMNMVLTTADLTGMQHYYVLSHTLSQSIL
jgi:hypothetical protein